MSSTDVAPPGPLPDLNRTAVEIAPETFWVGKREPGGIFYANPYLRRFRGTDARTKKPHRVQPPHRPGLEQRLLHHPHQGRRR